MNNTTTRTLCDLPGYEQEFADAIIDVIGKKHAGYDQQYRDGKISERVPLADIHFWIEDLENNIGIPISQEIAKRQGNPREEWRVTAQRMLDLYCNIGEIIISGSSCYKLNTQGSLYRDLTGGVASTP